MDGSEGENQADGLEIISIGDLYSGGPWEKKYWSCSRGKDRYPYPIGYHAVRTHAGSTYKMEIQEGIKGPLFVITSMEGDTCAGQTPDIAWEHFQKKSGPRVKTWHAKRLSCKIDGIELFGFRNPHVQRLLRELAANANGITEQILIHSNFCNGASNLEQEIRSPKSHNYPDLLLYLEKQQRTGKRSRKLKNTAFTSIAGDTPKRFRTHSLLDAAKFNIAAKGRIENNGSNNPNILGRTTKHDIPDQCPHSGNESVDSVNDRLTCPLDLKWQNDGKHATLTSNILDQNHFVHEDPAAISASNFDIVTDAIDGIIVKKNGLLVSAEVSNKSGKVPACPQEQSKLVVEDSQVAHVVPSGACFSLLSSQDLVSSEGAIMGSHPEEIRGKYCASLSSSGKSDSDAGQDLVKSMMTVLLPQALPLLKKTSKKKRAMDAGVPRKNSDPGLNLEMKSSAENDEASHFADALPKAGLPISGSNPDTDEKMQVPQTIPIDSLERGIPSDLKSVIPDSFEEKSACCFVNQRPLNSEFGESGQALLNKRACDDDVSAFLDNVGVKESSSFCHGDGNQDETVTGLNDPPEDNTILVSVNPVNWESPCKHTLSEVGEDENKINMVSNPIVSEADVILESSLENGINAVSNGAVGIAAVETLILVQGSAQNVLAEMSSESTGSESRKTDFVTNLSVLSSDDVNYKVAVPSSCKNLKIMNTEIPESLSSYRQDSSAKDLQNILVHTDPATLNTCKLSTTADARENNFNTDRQSTALYERAVNFDGDEDAHLKMQCNGKTIASGIDGNSLIHVHKGDTAASIGDYTIPSHGRRTLQNSSLPSQNYVSPLSESVVFRNIENNSIFEMNSAANTLCTTEICQPGAPAEKANGVLLSCPKSHLEKRQNNMNTLNGISEPDGVLSNNAPQNQVPIAEVNNDRHSLGDFCPSINNVELHQGDAVNEMIVSCKTEECSNAVLFTNKNWRTSLDKHESHVCKTPTYPDLHDCWKSVNNECSILPHIVIDSEHQPQDNISLKESKPCNEFEGFVQLVGCYFHPTPIVYVLLSQKDDDIYICVLCGLLQEKKRTLFIYKVTAERLSENCPSFCGYTSIELPLPRSGFNEGTIERSGLQFTPDGQCLVLLNSIKSPRCREQNIDCLCSLCTSNCCEENAVKVVQVQVGYVSVVCKLTTVETLYCILVCAPCYLVGAEASGNLHVWIMNLTWSACVEEFTLPSFDCPCPSLIELKRIPTCGSLVVGHNGIGGFGLWDISKRVLLSSFSSPGISVSHVLPVSVFGWEKKFPVSSGFVLEECIEERIAATKLWFSGDSENCEGLLPSGDDVALWLLVSAAVDADEQLGHLGAHFNGGLFGRWRLALLVKKTVIMGSILDPRASAAVASSGHAIIGTNDGLVYMWELSTGNRVANLKHLRGGVSCIATDVTSNTLAVVGNECQMMLYIRNWKDL